MAAREIEKLLKDKIGLHSSTIGSSTVISAVQQRMRKCRIDDMQVYLEVVRNSATELDALIDTVVIPETWFYRDRNVFFALSAWLKLEWLPRHAADTLRILSVPCSSGEEPYTLAMCLADCGIDPAAAHIDAVDVSRVNLERAAKGEYSINSFRGSDLAYRDHYFSRRGEHYHLDESIRRRVRFRHGNILDTSFAAEPEPYHVIFCRNLLIYFDRPTQQLTIDRLDKLLAPDGLLFLGHSETSLLLERPYAPLDHSRCFGFRRERRDAGAARPAKAERPRRTVRAATRKPAATVTALPFRDVERRQPVPQQSLPERNAPCELLTRAMELANQGHLDEAAQCCEELLNRRQHQADAYYILGLVRQSAGNSGDAEQLFRKTIYLQPDHIEALAHLSVILEQQGDTHNAARFRERARRVQQRTGAHEVAT
jgi:chemotaxis protein methyltransferase WspC